MARLFPARRYAVSIPSPALASAKRRAAPPPAPFPDGVWIVPVELALVLTTSLWGRLIRDRLRRCEADRAIATLHRIGGHWYAEAHFSDGRSDLFFPLDLVPAWISQESRS